MVNVRGQNGDAQTLAYIDRKTQVTARDKGRSLNLAPCAWQPSVVRSSAHWPPAWACAVTGAP